MSDEQLKNERREYQFSTLRRDDLNADPFKQFKRWLDEALARGIQDPTAMTIATVDAEGRPWSRIVLLKGFDESGFRFYTDLQSRKAVEIQGNPNVTLHFAWLQIDRQVIVSGHATPVDRSEAATYFASRPRESQLAAWASHQSEALSSRESLDAAYEEVSRRFDQTDVPLPEHWGGYRVAAEQFEFWQGGQHRLHDRFRYRRDANHWIIDRLSP